MVPYFVKQRKTPEGIVLSGVFLLLAALTSSFLPLW